MCLRLRDGCSRLRRRCRTFMVCLHLLKEEDEYDACHESTDVTPVINKESANEQSKIHPKQFNAYDGGFGALKAELSDNYPTMIEGSQENKDDNKEDKEKHLTTVQVVIPMSSEVTQMFFGVFEEKLKDSGFKAIMTDVTQVNAESDAICNDVVIVVCHNFSRLESNVSNVIKCFQVEQYQKIVLIIVHFKGKDYLPEQSSKGEILEENDDFKSLHSIVDIAFTATDGIYDCEMNTSAFQTIIDAASRKSKSEKAETKENPVIEKT